MPKEITVDKAKFDRLLKRMVGENPAPLIELRREVKERKRQKIEKILADRRKKV
jgi:hypothetical protein